MREFDPVAKILNLRPVLTHSRFLDRPDRLCLSSGLLFLLACILLASCTKAPIPINQADRQEYWPAPPEQPRYRHIMSIFSSDDISLKNDTNRLQELLVGKKNPAYELNRPLDIAVARGRIYIIDTSASVINVLDLQRRRYFNFGFRFEGKLSQPVSVAVDQSGLVYVADRDRNSILVYDSVGLYVSQINLANITSQIAGITVDPAGEFIYVVDRGGLDSNLHQFIKIDQQGQIIKQIGQRGKSAGEFNLPTDIVMGKQGNLYVLDSGNFRVQVFNSEGEYLKSWGKAGTNLGQFGKPRSIAVDQNNHLYISDAQFGNVQIFNTLGQLLLPIGQLSDRSGPGLYSLITGIAVDQDNYLYVLDQFFKRLDVFKKLTVP